MSNPFQGNDSQNYFGPEGRQPWIWPGDGNPGYAGYGSMNAGAPRFVTPLEPDAMESLSQGFKGFGNSWLAWLAGVIVQNVLFIVLAVVAALPVIVGTGVLGTASSPSDFQVGFFSGSLLLSLLLVLILAFLYSPWYLANVCAAAQKQFSGEKVTFGDFFRFSGRGGTMGTIVLLEIIVFIGLILFVIPGILAAIFLGWAAVAKAGNPSLTIGQAFRQSFEWAMKNFGQALLTCIFIIVMNFLAGFVPLLGFVTAPIGYLAYAHFQRSMAGEPSRVF